MNKFDIHKGVSEEGLKNSSEVMRNEVYLLLHHAMSESMFFRLHEKIEDFINNI